RCSQPLTDLMLNVFHVVGDHRATDDIGGNASERLADLLAALVLALPARAFGADRQDTGAKAHPSSLEAPTWPSPSSGGRNKLAVSLRRGKRRGPRSCGRSPSRLRSHPSGRDSQTRRNGRRAESARRSSPARRLRPTPPRPDV